jgi:hypothetical protein
MDQSVSTILNFSRDYYYSLLKKYPNFTVVFLAQYVNELKVKIDARMQTTWQSLDLINIQDFFPTLKDFDDKIKDPFYIRCFESKKPDNTVNYVVGYKGYKHDASDKGFSSFPSLGINLWILIYDPITNQKAFMFIKVESFYEIGTKHAMLLHLVAQFFPTLKIISAGEVKVEEMTTEDKNIFYKLTWNASSGTITKGLFDNRNIQLSFLSRLYPEINFFAINLQYRPQETLINKISQIEFGSELKYYSRIGDFSDIYENLILGMLQNFLSKIIMERVIPFAFPNVPTVNEFQYLQPNYTTEIAKIMPTFVNYDPSVTIDMVAKSNCANPYIRNNLYVFPNDADCKKKIETSPVVAPRYCDLLVQKANSYAGI